MIQDVFPHQFNIVYENATPDDDSRILFFNGDNLMVGHEDKEMEKYNIFFPTYEKVKEYGDKLTYLFSLDDKKYFRVVAEEKIIDRLNEADSSDENRYFWEKRAFFRGAKPKELVLVALTGMHLNGWYRNNIYCGRCGSPLAEDSKERMLFCDKCHNMVYPKINPAVIVAVTDKDKILLTKYNGRAYKRYALVAGFNEIGESLEETVRREVMEEVGLKVKNITYYKSQPWGLADNILAGFYCEVDGDGTISMDEEELSVAKWVSREDILDDLGELSLTDEMIANFKIPIDN